MKLGNPHFLLGLWLVPAIWLFYVWAFKKKRALIERFVSEQLRGRLLVGVSVGRQRFKAALIVTGVLFTVVALLQPRWGFHWEEIKRRGVDIIVALDVSKSMLAEDISPNRLERAKRKIEDFLRIVQGDRVGLIAFAGTAFLQCPLTLDHGAVQIFLDSVDTTFIPVPGTAINEAIDLATRAFERSDRNARALILITDGEQTTGSDLDAAKRAGAQGIKIYTIGVGKGEGAPIPNPEGGGFKKDRQGNVVMTKLDESGLQKVALETGASYVRSVSGDLDLEKVYEDIQKNTEDRELKTGRQKRYEERFQWPLAVAFICFVLEAILSERSRSRAAGRFFAGTKGFRSWRLGRIVSWVLMWVAGAMSTTVLAANARKGETLYRQQKYNEALKELVDAQIENPSSLELKYNTASAYYQSHQYQQAQKLFTAVAASGNPKLSQKAVYNLGNTFYRQGKLQEALSYFQRASELDPTDEDARHNLEFVRKEIRRRLQQNENRGQKPEKEPNSSAEQKNSALKPEGQSNTATQQKDSAQKPSSQKQGDSPSAGKGLEQKGAEGSEDRRGPKEGAGSAKPVRKMSDEEAKQWLSTLKESDRVKHQRRVSPEARQYEVERDW